MLQHLTIKNYTLIDELELDFSSGFSVITGETGAGKSIIIGAIALILGQRADLKQLKAGKNKCTIEAHFDLSRYDIESFFASNDIDFDKDDCIVRREITASGKSRAFINDTPVSLSTMKELGEKLIDIHSQHQNLLVGKENFQMSVVDIVAKCSQQLEDFKTTYNQYQKIKRELEDLKEEALKNKANEDYLRFQLNELESAALQPGEQEGLEKEFQAMSHAEEIKTALFNAENSLVGDNNCIEMIKQCTKNMSDITNVFGEVLPLNERLESCIIELKDIAQEISSQLNDIDFDPNRLQYCEERLDLIYKLQQKHRVENTDDLIEIEKMLYRQLQSIDNSDEIIKEKETEVSTIFNKCTEKANILTNLRKKAAKAIEKETESRLTLLGINNARFTIDITQTTLNQNGHDNISFLFSANKGTSLQPISNVASGGEIARVMLSLKTMISNMVKLPTIIFDEIDTGVSGKIAEQMATMMEEMATNQRQVISITHLPQIASKGKIHYKVNKQETASGTSTTMSQLNTEQRIEEIAQMLSGSTITEAATNNARQLLGLN